MLYAEQKTETGYTYETDNVAGSTRFRLVITSQEKLEADMLDQISHAVMGANIRSGTVTDTISFEYSVVNDWAPENEDGEQLGS